jgi:hypothetical protein
VICLLGSSICFEQLCAHPREEYCINTTSGIITLKLSELSKITNITRIHRGCIVHKTLIINDKVLVKSF